MYVCMYIYRLVNSSVKYIYTYIRKRNSNAYAFDKTSDLSTKV